MESNKNKNKSDGLNFIQSHYGAMRDSSIILKTFIIIRNFTTFSLNGELFIQVFKESKKDKTEGIYGFCLIKL